MAAARGAEAVGAGDVGASLRNLKIYALDGPVARLLAEAATDIHCHFQVRSQVNNSVCRGIR